jgi:ferric-dicitrate binding protein FerR (iron transport regulator)
MTRDELARSSRAILEPLRRSPIGVSSSEDAESDRARLVPRLEALVQQMPDEHAAAKKRRSWTRLLAAAAMLASLSAMVFLIAQSTGDHGRAERAGGTGSPASPGQGEAPPTTGNGDRFIGAAAIETQPQEVARFVTESGVELALGPASKARVRPAERSQYVELMRGTVSLDVPPLPAGSTFSVVTPDATVTVHGTRFSVSYSATSLTCVQVREGKVSVARRDRAPELLVAGQASGCDRAVGGAGAASRDRGLAEQRPTSTLAEENRLLRRALAAEQRGDGAAATRAAHDLLGRHPSSPFAEEARRIVARIESRRERP